MSIVDFYRCERCGNIVALIKKGGGTLTCCGQAMTKLEANSTDAAKEKHCWLHAASHAAGAPHRVDCTCR